MGNYLTYIRLKGVAFMGEPSDAWTMRRSITTTVDAEILQRVDRAMAEIHSAESTHTKDRAALIDHLFARWLTEVESSGLASDVPALGPVEAAEDRPKPRSISDRILDILIPRDDERVPLSFIRASLPDVPLRDLKNTLALLSFEDSNFEPPAPDAPPHPPRRPGEPPRPDLGYDWRVEEARATRNGSTVLTYSYYREYRQPLPTREPSPGRITPNEDGRGADSLFERMRRTAAEGRARLDASESAPALLAADPVATSDDA